MRKLLGLSASAMVVAPSGASAEILSSSSNGFEVRHSATLVVPPESAFASFVAIAGWWSGEHTYSGKASNLTLTPRAGGCFCEMLPNGGGVEHLRVAIAMPGQRLVLTGGLGPVLYQAASGVMDVNFEKVAGGTKVTMTYGAGGFAKGGADKLAPLVDQVLGAQMKTYRSFATANGPAR